MTSNISHRTKVAAGFATLAAASAAVAFVDLPLKPDVGVVVLELHSNHCDAPEMTRSVAALREQVGKDFAVQRAARPKEFLDNFISIEVGHEVKCVHPSQAVTVKKPAASGSAPS